MTHQSNVTTDPVDVAKQLQSCSSTMANSLTKLFGRDRQAIRSSAKIASMKIPTTIASTTASTKNKACKYTVYCLNKECYDVPKDSVRSSLPSKEICFFHSDTECKIKNNIHSLFPDVFKPTNEEAAPMQYHYLKATSNKLKIMTSYLPGHTSWNGEAVAKLCGQGSLYVMPLHVKVQILLLYL